VTAREDQVARVIAAWKARNAALLNGLASGDLNEFSRLDAVLAAVGERNSSDEEMRAAADQMSADGWFPPGAFEAARPADDE
jgi:hypothetical protein